MLFVSCFFTVHIHFFVSARALQEMDKKRNNKWNRFSKHCWCFNWSGPHKVHSTRFIVCRQLTWTQLSEDIINSWKEKYTNFITNGGNKQLIDDYIISWMVRFIWTAFAWLCNQLFLHGCLFCGCVWHHRLFFSVFASFFPFEISLSSSIGFIRSLTVFFTFIRFHSISFALFRFHSLSFNLFRSYPFSLAQCLFHSSYSTKMALYRILARNLGSIAFQ